MSVSSTPYHIFLIVLQAIHCSFGITSAAAADESFHIIENSVSTELRNKTVTSIAEGVHGEIYFGTQEGLYIFDGRATQFVAKTSSNSEKVIKSSISKVVVAPNGHVWFASDEHGIHRFSPMRAITESPKALDSLRFRSIENLLIDNNGNLFITDESKVWKYDLARDRLRPIQFSDVEDPGRIRSNAITMDSEGIIWIGTGKGLWKLLENQEVFEQISDIGIAVIGRGKASEIVAVANEGYIIVFSTESNLTLLRSPSFKQDYISATGIKLINNTYVISSDQGVLLFDSSLTQIEKYSTENSLISNDHITEMAVIADSLYIATFRGVSTAVFTSLKWFDQLNSKIDNEVLSISEDSNNTIWVGTYGGIYYRLEDERAHYPLVGGKSSLTIDNIRTMDLTVTNNYALIGTWESGLVQTQLHETDHRKYVAIESEELTSGSITKIFFSNEKNLWIGKYNGELNRRHSVKERIQARELKPVIVLDGPILNISNVDNRTLLVSTEKSLYFVDEALAYTRKLSFPSKDSRTNPIILSFHISEQGEIWLGTLRDGIYRSTPIDSLRDQKISFSRVIHPSTNHTFYAMESAKDGSIWASSNLGITVFDKQSNYRGSIGKRDGLKSMDFNQGASYADSNGNLYFGGSNGYTVFNPSDISFERKPSPMLLTGLDIAGKQSIPSTSLPYIDEVEISHRDRFITFMFNVVDYFDASQSQYRYMLQGFDPDWVDAVDRDSATFTNLPAGNYVFRAQGSNSDGVWNREGINVNLIVHPAPWLTLWAYALYSILFAMFLSSLKRTYDTYVLKEKATTMAEKMTRAVEDAMDDLQEQLESQDVLVKRFHHRNLNMLDLLSDLEKLSWPGEPKSYLFALEALENTLSYQGDRLLFDLQACTNRIVAKVLAANPAKSESINTILDIPQAHLAAPLGSYLAIALYETITSAAAHLPQEAELGRYIHIAINILEDRSVQLTVLSDLGETSDPSLSSGQPDDLQHLSLLLDKVGATLDVEATQQQRVVIIIPPLGITDRDIV